MARKTSATERRPWWGAGDAPHKQWPGVSLEIAVTWPTARSRWESHGGRYYFDEAAADLACEFFPKYLQHYMGRDAGRPFDLLPYQAKLLTRPIFGWKRTSDGLRRFRKAFFFGPKGCGKSPWLAGTGLFLALCDREAAAEVYAVAADRLQARIVHDSMKVFIEDSPELAAQCEILRDSIFHPASRSSCQVLASDAASAHGRRPHAVLFDELHAQRNRDLFEALKKSMAKRVQPLLLLASHAGDDDEGICYEEYEGAKRVLSGAAESEESFLPVIFEASPEEDWTSPATWHRVNPGLGVTAHEAAIAIECEEARSEPRKVNDFLRFELNRWVNQAVAWIPIDWWDACDEHMPSDAELAECQCAVGIDMSQKIDLTSAVAVFRIPLAESVDETIEVMTGDDAGEKMTRRLSLNYQIAIVPSFWLPEDTLRDRVRQDHVPYDTWRDQRLVNVTDGTVIDSAAIVRHVAVTLPARFSRIKEAEIGYDPAFATEVGVRLRDTHGMKAIEVLQNYKHLSEACQVFEALVKAGRVIHGGHRVLRWNVENVAVKQDDAGRIRPVKPRRAGKRIDGVVATLIALSRLIAQPEVQESVQYFREIWPD